MTGRISTSLSKFYEYHSFRAYCIDICGWSREPSLIHQLSHENVSRSRRAHFLPRSRVLEKLTAAQFVKKSSAFYRSRYCDHTSPPLVPPTLLLPKYLVVVFFLQVSRPKFYMFLSHLYCIPIPSHFSWFNHPNMKPSLTS